MPGAECGEELNQFELADLFDAHPRQYAGELSPFVFEQIAVQA